MREHPAKIQSWVDGGIARCEPITLSVGPMNRFNSTVAPGLSCTEADSQRSREGVRERERERPRERDR
jgi:hypothetical protein